MAMLSIFSLLHLLLLFLLLVVGESQISNRCGVQGGGRLCPEGQCCSNDGYCGGGEPHYGPCCFDCQSQCSSVTECPLSLLIDKQHFEFMLPRLNDERCQARGFYTYEAFIEAARSFPDFGNVGYSTARKREIAAFFAQTSHQTDGWPGADYYSWGYCFLAPNGSTNSYCIEDDKWPCVPGKKYYGRGPFQISYNFNYGPAGEALGLDLLSNPDLVETDPVIAFKTALWFWMTEKDNKPSCHDIMVHNWNPSAQDIAAGRLVGFGATTNVINGLDECDHGIDPRGENRIGFYTRFLALLKVSWYLPEYNVDCYQQQAFDKDWLSHLKLPGYTSQF